MILRERHNIIPLLAIVVLAIGSISTLYVFAIQVQQSTQNELILINNQSLEIQAIFDSLSNKTIQTNDGEKMGISLSELLNSTQLSCPSCHSYTIKAKDGYQQTVIWDDMQQGVLTMEKRVYFPHLAHAFWIRDVVEIEVK